MDTCELAVRAFESIRGTGHEGIGRRVGGDEISAWIERFACPAIAELLADERFRNDASYWLSRLLPDSSCSERERLNALDLALVDSASQLVKLAQVPEIMERLRRLGQYQESLPSEQQLDIPIGFEAVSAVASRPWRDLVAATDYFQPWANLNLQESAERLAQFMPAFNPRLRPIGDFVGRMTLLRADYWCAGIAILVVRCGTLFGQGVPAPSSWEDLQQSLGSLRELLDGIRALLTVTPEARLANSATALVQVFRDYQPTADLTWLQLPENVRRHGIGVIRDRLENRNEVFIGDQVASALSDFRGFLAQKSKEDELREAIKKYQLVLVERPRTAIWHEAIIETDWETNNLLWELVWTLANKALRGEPVDRYNLSNPESDRAITDRRSRLRTFLPSELNSSIVSAGRKTYRLDLASNQIRTFPMVEVGDELMDAAELEARERSERTGFY